MSSISSCPRWLEHLLDLRRSYINPIELNAKYKDWHEEVVRYLGGLFPGELRVHLIADERQTAEVISRKDYSALFFDVGQSAILESIFSGMVSQTPQDDVFVY